MITRVREWDLPSIIFQQYFSIQTRFDDCLRSFCEHRGALFLFVCLAAVAKSLLCMAAQPQIHPPRQTIFYRYSRAPFFLFLNTFEFEGVRILTCTRIVPFHRRLYLFC